MKYFHPTVQNGVIVMVEDQNAFWVSKHDARQLQEQLTSLNLTCSVLGFDARCWKILRYIANTDPNMTARQAASQALNAAMSETAQETETS